MPDMFQETWGCKWKGVKDAQFCQLMNWDIKFTPIHFPLKNIQYWPIILEWCSHSVSDNSFSTLIFQPTRCFYTCLSVQGGGGVSASVHAGIPPPPPPGSRHLPEKAPPSADGYCCGQYVSYWNAFLYYWFCLKLGSGSRNSVRDRGNNHEHFLDLFYRTRRPPCLPPPMDSLLELFLWAVENMKMLNEVKTGAGY